MEFYDFPYILGMSSSQLTNIFQRGWNHRPVSAISFLLSFKTWFSMVFLNGFPLPVCSVSEFGVPVPWFFVPTRRALRWLSPVVFGQWWGPHKEEPTFTWVYLRFTKIWQWVKAVGPKPLSSFGKDFTSQLRLVCFNSWDVNWRSSSDPSLTCVTGQWFL
jgi:hypothetical protein